jgi:hypothetical protein
MSRTTRRGLTAVVGLAGFAGLIAVDELVLRALFETHYLSWYLANGAMVSLVVAFVTLAWGDLNALTDLISAHPLEYARAHVNLCTLPNQSLGAIQAPRGPAGRAAGVPTGLPVADAVLTAAVSVLLVAVCVVYTLVVAPVQYLVYLVAGAPGRMACASPERAWQLIGPSGLEVGSKRRSEELPEGATESAYTAQPVTFTAVLASALLFAIQQVVA